MVSDGRGRGQSDNNWYDCKYVHAEVGSGNLLITDHSTLILCVCATQQEGLCEFLKFQTVLLVQRTQILLASGGSFLYQ